MLETINIPVIKKTTEMLRKYLVEYQAINNCGKVTIDNIRRSLSTFFSWLEEEDYIIKSPMKRIHKVKTAIIVKDTIPDEKVEILRDNCNNLRDRAMIDFLLSTGIRVGELVKLNIDDIDFSERECVVYGKGDKERKAYFYTGIIIIAILIANLFGVDMFAKLQNIVAVLLICSLVGMGIIGMLGAGSGVEIEQPYVVNSDFKQIASESAAPHMFYGYYLLGDFGRIWMTAVGALAVISTQNSTVNSLASICQGMAKMNMLPQILKKLLTYGF